MNYLCAAQIDDGLLINFGADSLQYKHKYRHLCQKTATPRSDNPVNPVNPVSSPHPDNLVNPVMSPHPVNPV